MQDYSIINGILLRTDSSFEEFYQNLTILAIQKQTYLNLFLTTVATVKAINPQFKCYVDLLINFKNITGKKSANINYIGYKDRKSVLMHACSKGNRQTIEALLVYKDIDLNAVDQFGRSIMVYAIQNNNEENSNSIINLLLQKNRILINLQSESGSTVLHEAFEMRRFSTFQLFLKAGAKSNAQLKVNGNTISHEIIQSYKNNKELSGQLILLLLKYRANFFIKNWEGKNVIETANDVGLSLEQCINFYRVDGQEPVQQTDNQQDKQSMTTFNPKTKISDTVSEICQIQSNICSHKVYFSEIDQQQFNDPQQSQDDIELIKSGLDYAVFSEELMDFSLGCQEKYKNTWITLDPFFKSLEKIVVKYNLLIQVVGSFATGLWCSYSDININLIPKTSQYINFETILEKIFKAMRHKKGQLGINDIYLNKNKINSIKLGLNSKLNSHIVEISIFHRNNPNKLYVQYIKDTINTLPVIKPLFFAFRKICETFNLHDHILGGIKTYTLFLMIATVLKTQPHKSIGQLFHDIVLYYAFYFEFDYEFPELIGQLIHENYPVMRINLIDPLNNKNNTGGKNTRAKEVQIMFRALYYCLNQIIEPQYFYQLLQLSHIF